MEPSEEINEEAEQETVDFSKPDFVFVPKEYHEWRQRGPYIICKSCDIEHAVFIGMEKILTGLDEKGQPILKTR